MNATSPSGSRRAAVPLAMIPTCQMPWDGIDWFPPVDILEDTEAYLFRIDLPEVKAEDIQVTVEGGAVIISGERPKAEAGDMKYVRIERPHGRFERRFALPADASIEEMDSGLSEFVLELRVPKARPVAPGLATAEPAPELETSSAV